MRNCGLAGVIAITLGLSTASAVSIKKEGERKKAPEFELSDSQGNAVRLSAFAGRVVLLDFWATWCAPCIESIPWMNDLQRRYERDGLTVIGISMDEDGWGTVKPFMEKTQIAYSILMGNKRVAYLYGDVASLPLAFFVDRSGRVAGIHLGAAKKEEFEKTIRRLLEDSR